MPIAARPPVEVETDGEWPLFELPITAEGQPPSEYRVFAYGVNPTSKGDYLFDEASASSVMAAYADQGNELMSDWEHSSLLKPPVDLSTKASSWFTPQIRGDELGHPELWSAGVRWTPRAFQQLSDGETRYFSPAFDYEAQPDKATGARRIVRLINIALTNLPATKHMTPLVAASETAEDSAATTDPKEKPMKSVKCTQCKKAIQGLSMADDGEENTAYHSTCAPGEAEAKKLTAALSLDPGDAPAMLSQATQLGELRREVLSITGAKELGGAIGTLRAHAESHTKVAQLTADLATREKAERFTAFDALVKEGQDGKKISPAMLSDGEWIPKLRAQEGGIEILRGYLKTATPLVVTVENAAKPVEIATAQLNDTERKLAEQTRVPTDQVAQHRADLQAKGKLPYAGA